MIYKDFAKNVLNVSAFVGDKVWICDFRHEDISNKPIRHVEPQEVVIEDNANLPKNKSIYYADIHFLPIGKNGQPKKQVIAPFDNTGYRSFTGESVHVFETEKECREFYMIQCEAVRKQIKEGRKKSAEWFDHIEANLNKEIQKNKP